MKLLTVTEYVKDATRTIEHAQKRIYLISTILDEDITTQAFLDAIRAAARRGIEVLVAGDAYTFTEIGGHFRLNSQFSKRLRSVSGLKRSFEKAGAKFIWLGSDTSTLLNGRTHTKWLIVDDTVYSFGGVNLYQAGIQSSDLMFKTTDHDLADRLIGEQRRIAAAVKNRHAYRSHAFRYGSNQVYIDGGFVGDSIIYRRACHLIKTSSETIFVSQYCPNGKLGHLLKKNNAKLYFNPWNQANSLNAVFIHVTSKLTGLKTLYKRKPYIHCKFIICTMPDGSKTALTGSHNFAQGGVWLGTREVALETSDPLIITQLEKFVEKYIS